MMQITICPPAYAYGYASPGEMAALERDTRNVGEPFGALGIMRAGGKNRGNRAYAYERLLKQSGK